MADSEKLGAEEKENDSLAPTKQRGEQSRDEQSLTSEAPPNGGHRAWLQIAGAFFLYFNSW